MSDVERMTTAGQPRRPLGMLPATSGERPTVVVLAKYYHPYNGGIENATRVFCEGMVPEYRVRVIAFNHNPGFSRETINGVDIERYNVHAVIKSQPISVGYLLAAIRARGQMTHFHAPNIVASLAIALRRPRRLLSVHHMDIYGRPKLRWIARKLYRIVLMRSELLVVTSLKNFSVSSDIAVDLPARAVPLGIDPASYALSDAERAEARKWRRSIVGDAPVVGFIGRHARYKGLDVMLRAIAQLPGVHAVIGGDGPYRQEAEALSRTLNIADRVHFLGEISHERKLQLLASIDAFAFPSTEITEAFGVSQLEAMMLGAAVVASDLPTGVSDVSINGQTALTVPPGDVDAFSQAVGRLLSDEPFRQQITKRARAHVLREFTTEIMVARFNALNKDVFASALRT